MKKLLLLLLVILGMASCKKDDIRPKEKMITYEVKCQYCLVYVDDVILIHKPFTVNGIFTYTTRAGELDSARIETYTAAYSAPQMVSSSVSIDGKLKASKKGLQQGNLVSYSVPLK
jgi:hypothetical protein